MLVNRLGLCLNKKLFSGVVFLAIKKFFSLSSFPGLGKAQPREEKALTVKGIVAEWLKAATC